MTSRVVQAFARGWDDLDSKAAKQGCDRDGTLYAIAVCCFAKPAALEHSGPCRHT